MDSASLISPAYEPIPAAQDFFFQTPGPVLSSPASDVAIRSTNVLKAPDMLTFPTSPAGGANPSSVQSAAPMPTQPVTGGGGGGGGTDTYPIITPGQAIQTGMNFIKPGIEAFTDIKVPTMADTFQDAAYRAAPETFAPSSALVDSLLAESTALGAEAELGLTPAAEAALFAEGGSMIPSAVGGLITPFSVYAVPSIAKFIRSNMGNSKASQARRHAEQEQYTAPLRAVSIVPTVGGQEGDPYWQTIAPNGEEILPGAPDPYTSVQWLGDQVAREGGVNLSGDPDVKSFQIYQLGLSEQIARRFPDTRPIFEAFYAGRISGEDSDAQVKALIEHDPRYQESLVRQQAQAEAEYLASISSGDSGD